MIYEPTSELYIPVYFVLLQSKLSGAYSAALYHCICSIGRTKFDAISVTCDFEQSLILAINENIENPIMIGCLFHWKQALRRKLKQFNINSAMISELMDGHGLINLLPEIPISDIESKGIPYIRSTYDTYKDGKCYAAEFDRFWNYFIHTWMIKYPPTLWNVNAILCHNMSNGNSNINNNNIINRTNNGLERFNRKLNDAFPTAHPNMRTFVSTIRDISFSYVIRYEKIKNKLEMPPRHLPVTTYVLPSNYLSFKPIISNASVTKNTILAKYSIVIYTTHFDDEDKVFYKVIDIDIDKKDNIIGKRIQIGKLLHGQKPISDWVFMVDILKYMNMTTYEL